jgi:hypothetical protein
VFTELYAKLPAEKQVLPTEILKELLAGKAP